MWSLLCLASPTELMCLRFIHPVARIRIPFLCEATDPLHGWTTPSIHSIVGGYLGSFHFFFFFFWLLWIVLWISLYTFVWGHIFSVILGRQLRMELPGHVLIQGSNFWGTISFPNWLPHSPFLLAVSKDLFLHILTNTYILVFLTISILMGVSQPLIVALIWVSRVAGDTEHLFMCLLATGVSSLRNVCFNPLLF